MIRARWYCTFHLSASWGVSASKCCFYTNVLPFSTSHQKMRNHPDDDSSVCKSMLSAISKLERRQKPAKRALLTLNGREATDNTTRHGTLHTEQSVQDWISELDAGESYTHIPCSGLPVVLRRIMV
ncbi:hypothetical protein PYCCODRAFT_605957 [Trametes coccinea BRFM310]|uniref:HTH CENPB-type domain-containing protein n=1 Tax=Trametes coccinea (strain BRFM310) TaxID=1353009 RepID=A0A1Y2J1U3_TRAC3|nr:hypothetical protein PYCCODRAFT_605957 [Trametes coccinea BRFM310]